MWCAQVLGPSPHVLLPGASHTDGQECHGLHVKEAGASVHCTVWHSTKHGSFRLSISCFADMLHNTADPSKRRGLGIATYAFAHKEQALSYPASPMQPIPGACGHRCISGYARSPPGFSTSMCLKNGTWTSLPTCSVARCVPLPVDGSLPICWSNCIYWLDDTNRAA
jgi:hypothetical protein